MRASLDTNVVIHFYRGKLQHILFECVKIENLVNAMEIYIEAILRLDEMVR